MTTTSAGRALRALIALALIAPFTLLAAATPGTAHAAGGHKLSGLFRIDRGSCSGSSVSGTYFRMIQQSGNANGPYLSNSDSPCSDQSYTPLGAGTDGGLRTNGYQPPPSPAFDKDGNATAGKITAPAKFYGTNFATGTASTDAQTKKSVPVPSVTVSGSKLSADLRAFSVTWNKQYFNQGSPKPNGSYPGLTRRATGTYDAGSGHFTLDWTSQIQGGPFDGFTGKWHLTGTFVGSGGSSAGTSGGSSGGHTAGTTSGDQAGATGGQTSSGGTSGTAGHRSGGGSYTTTEGGTAGRTVGGAKASGKHAAAAKKKQKAAAKRGNAAGPVSGNPQPLAETHTTTRPVWNVSWPVVGLAAVVAVAGFAALYRQRVIERRKELSWSSED